MITKDGKYIFDNFSHEMRESTLVDEAADILHYDRTSSVVITFVDSN